MITRLFLLLLCLPITIFAQSPDTSVVYPEVDKLLQISKDHASNEKYQEMHDDAVSATSLALEKSGPASIKYAECLQQQGYALFRLAEYQKCVELFEQVADIRKSVLGDQHSEYATSLSNLGSAYRKAGAYDKAKTAFLETIAIREKAEDKEPLKYAINLNNLAQVYKDLGNYDMAKRNYLKSKSIYEQEQKTGSKNYATTLNNIAGTEKKLGNYENAETFYSNALLIIGKTLGPEHTKYAQILNNKASLYLIMGNYEKAEALYTQAKSIREKVYGKEHLKYASSLNNLAGIHRRRKEYPLAEKLYKESSAIREKKSGPDHPKYAESLNNLGALYLRTGEYDKAETFLQKALDIDKKVFGKEHQTYAKRLNNLGVLYLRQGNYDKAEPLFLSTKSIREKALGKEHDLYGACLSNLANLYFTKKEYEKASTYYKDANKIRTSQLVRAADYLSGNELYKYLESFKVDMANFSSFIHQSKLDELVKDAYNNSLFYKGFLLSNALRVEHIGANAPDDIQEVYYEWKACRRQLVKEYLKPTDKRTGVITLEEKANSLEKTLLKSAPELEGLRKQIDYKDILAHLQKGEAAIEFFHFRYQAPEDTDSVFYVAQVLIAGEQSPRQVFLFEEKELNKSLEPRGARDAGYVNRLYTLDERGLIVVDNDKPKSLYKLIWEPLKDMLAETETIYFAPSGLLHRINLSAISVDDEENLASQYQLVQLNSTRQLVSPTPIDTSIANHKVILYGGIQYNTDSLLLHNGNRENRGEGWGFLKGTKREVENLGNILQKNNMEAEMKSGLEATEESLMQLGQPGKPSPRVLHIATHGYFFPEPENSDAENSPGNANIFKISERPMLRSGLIFSGGNDSWINKQPRASQSDGILTALEISQLDFSQTELVVLSACETGLGTIQGNEGVYGLQRALKIAGVKYVIMSLWRVPDRQTPILMKHFYTKWLEDKMPLRAAFAAAQKEMFEMGMDPYHWAGFVFIE